MVRTDIVYTAGDRMTPDIAVSIAKQAEKFNANLLIEYENKSIQLDSLIGVLSMELQRGMALTVVAEGADEAEAAKAICSVLTEA